MVTPGVTLGSWVTLALLITGSTGLVCYTAVDSLDLGCLLRWDCPRVSPNATYTVQTKTQGGPWQDVTWCVWVSSQSCDVSGAFSNFEQYNMIRVGVHLSPGATFWVTPHKFDYSDFTFSPPSVSVSVKEDQLLVKVQFPCSASRRCSLKSCCPISELIDPWTTVTVYNQLNRSDSQSRTVWTQEVASYVEFSGLAAGQDYCAVANFSFPTFSMAASPTSRPQCVRTVSRPGPPPLPPVLLGIGLCSALVVPLLIRFLLKRIRSATTTENRPKTPEPVDVGPPASVTVDPSDIHVELVDDHVCMVSSSTLCNQDRTSSLGNAYADDLLQTDSTSGGAAESERGLDSGVSIPPVETCGSNED